MVRVGEATLKYCGEAGGGGPCSGGGFWRPGVLGRSGEAGQRVGKKRAEAGRSQVEEVARPG